jgi:hypothetical protein
VRVSDPWLGVAGEGVELGEVMNILGTMLVPGPEAALLACRQARHGAPGDQPAGEGIRRVIKESAGSGPPDGRRRRR